MFGAAERVVVEEFVCAHLAPAEEETILEEVLFEEEFGDFEAVVVEAVDETPEEALAGGDGGGGAIGEGVAVADADGEGEGPAGGFREGLPADGEGGVCGGCAAGAVGEGADGEGVVGEGEFEVEAFGEGVAGAAPCVREDAGSA